MTVAKVELTRVKRKEQKLKSINLQTTVTHSDMAASEESLRDLVCVSSLAMHPFTPCLPRDLSRLNE